ncbi:unnamed protein product [Nesidiocoris tenuis]|uniref:Tf2-1-like SH3-like domain-containing protein n=1 Tax=Nesidiocoris tenuis TaxID=355587 RepID=A0A6H5H1W5_9HEMI|nr:unnamed protein product [Nesidiocoris tenuis]
MHPSTFKKRDEHCERNNDFSCAELAAALTSIRTQLCDIDARLNDNSKNQGAINSGSVPPHADQNQQLSNLLRDVVKTVKFDNDRDEDPHQYLAVLEPLLRTITDVTELKIYIAMTLGKKTKRWWYAVEKDVNNWYDFSRKFLERFWSEDIQDQVIQNVQNEKSKKQMDRVNRTRKYPSFTSGDLVLLETVRTSSAEAKTCAKLLPLWEGPFRIKNRVGQFTYELEIIGSRKSRGNFHVDLIVKYKEPLHPWLR